MMALFVSSYGFNMYGSLWLKAWSGDQRNSCLIENCTIFATNPVVDGTAGGGNGNVFYALFNPSGVALTSLQRLIVFSFVGFSECVLVLVAMKMLSNGCHAVSVETFRRMLTSILDSPMDFFQATPLGRVLTRFSRDIDVIDYPIWMNFRAVIQYFLRASVAILIVSLQSWLFLICLLPVLGGYVICQCLYIRTKRQLIRLNLASRGPILSLLQETLNGASCIRAFDAGQRFEQSYEKRVDTNHEFQLPSMMAR